ncbi:hypothetical protein D3C72_2484010 [compost metagenome]
MISTLASIAIPSASAIAAIPGSVKVTWIIDSKPTSNSRLVARASTLKAPNSM